MFATNIYIQDPIEPEIRGALLDGIRGGRLGRSPLESANRSPNVWSQMTVFPSSTAVENSSLLAVSGIRKPGRTRSSWKRFVNAE
jgi:hypothetical protein